MNKILEVVYKNIFEKTPLLAWLNGHKKAVGMSLIILSGILGTLHKLYPELMILDQINAYYVMIVGILGYQIGDFHDDIKDGKLVIK